MADVFISYASEDRDRVRPLAEALSNRGFSIWWDRALASGQDYSAVIEREIAQAKAVIVVWTQNSAASTYVRDEASRARDQGRLCPVMLDPVQIPLGFGSYQADDFTKWNGARNAAQVQILEESIKAKLSGRDVDSIAVERKRRRLGSRIRIVSVLTVLALIVVIAVGGKQIFTPPQHHATQQDLQAQLLQLLAEGKLTPEQAAQLAQIMGLENGALGSSGSTQVASSDDGSAAPGAPATEPAPSDQPAEVQLASDQQFSTDAQAAYRDAIASLLTHPDLQVRQAALHLSDPAQRDASIQALLAYAQAHPDDANAAKMFVVAGAVGEANDSPLGQQALVAAANVTPENPTVWRMLSHSYRRANQTAQADAAISVSQGVQAQASGDAPAAEQHLQEALPNLTSPQLQAPVASQLGDIAETRGDYGAASARFAQAYSLRERSAQPEQTAVATRALQSDAQRLVVALDRSGRTQEACQRLQEAQTAHDVAAPEQAIVDRCQTRYRTQLRPGVVNQRMQQRAITPSSTTP